MARKLSVLLTLALALLFMSSRDGAADPGGEGAPADRYAVPDGGPEALIEFMERLVQIPPIDEPSREKTFAALHEAFDRVLAAKATDEQVETAVQLKLSLFRGQVEPLTALAEKLATAGHDRLARQLKGSVLVDQLRAAMRGPREEALPGIEQVVGQIGEFLEAGPFAAPDVRLGMMAAQVAELAGNQELAAEVYRKLQRLTAASDDPRMPPLAESFAGAVRRLTLVGKPMEIKGTTLDGEPFDWSKYTGKTVLVSFWATWCGPCISEIPNLKRLYDAYHNKGFDIVGISLDKGREPLEQFVKERELPWTILFENEDRNPTADYYGVVGIPMMILVGADGKVISTQARGEELDELLADRFGPIPEEDARGE